MRGIVLAAGIGKRLRPFTNFIAKSLLPVGGRPAIIQILEDFNALNISEIAVVISHLGYQIRDYLDKGDYRVTYIDEGKPLGTGHALLVASDFIQDDVLVAATDCILPREHLKELCAYHLAEKCDVTLSLKMLSEEEMLSSATVVLEKDNSISRIIEKPTRDEILSNVASSPYYVVNESIKRYLPRVKLSRRGEYELADAFQMMIDDGLKVKGVLSEEYMHLSNIQDLIALNKDFFSRATKQENKDKWTL